MQTKLTLSIDQTVVERAKAYAKKQGTSLSKLVQEMLKEQTKGEQKHEVVEVPEEFKGVYGAFELPEDFDFRKEKAKYIKEKYERLG